MEREKVIELAKKAKLAAYEDEILEFARLVEQETLESAAMVCETNARELVFDDHSQGCRDCASDIRNLKDNHDKE